MESGKETPYSKLELERQLSILLSSFGGEIFIKSSNTENLAIMKAISDGENPDELMNLTVLFDLTLEFMSAMMTRKYDDAFRLAENVRELEPDNKIARDFLPILDKIRNLSADNSLQVCRKETSLAFANSSLLDQNSYIFKESENHLGVTNSLNKLSLNIIKGTESISGIVTIP